MKLVQKEKFKNSSFDLKGLIVERDNDNILRVKTKLGYCEDKFNFKFSILLPHDHAVVQLLIFHEHVISKHMSTQSLLQFERR